MAFGAPPIPRFENSKEKEPPYKLEIVFFETNFNTTEDLLNGLAKLEKNEGNNAAIVLDEYQMKADDVIDNAHQISEEVVKKGYDLVMAPDSQNNSSETQKVSWEKRIEQLKQNNISFEEGDEPREWFETIGFFFGKDGQIYAFPKMWEKKSVHQIPGRDIGVTICGEIHNIKPEETEGVNVIYNPSRERDDPYMQFRMMGLLNPNMSREDVVELWYHHMPGDRGDLDKEYDWEEQDTKEAREYYSLENRKKRFNAKIDDLVAMVNNPKEDSMYMRKVKENFPDMKIPIIRADADCSGIVNPGDSTRLKSIEKRDGYSKWSFEFQK